MTTIIRVRRENRRSFLVCDKRFTRETMGLEAIGLLTYLLAHPDDWRIHRDHIARQTGSSQYAVRRAIETLDRFGYIRRSPVRDRRTGRIVRWEILVFETTELAASNRVPEPALFESVETRRARKPRFQRDTPDAEKPWGGPPAAGQPPGGSPAAGGRLLQSTETEDPVESEQQHRGVAVALAGVGLGRETIDRLIAEQGIDAVRRALRCLQARRHPPGNPAGFVIQAAKLGWHPPAAADCGRPGDRGRAETAARQALALIRGREAVAAGGDP